MDASAAGDGNDPVLTEIEKQANWYDRKAREAQRWFRRVKVVELVIATSVPPLAGLKASPILVSILASLVVLLEGIQHLFQFQANWLAYRSACEALRQELFLFGAEAGPYAAATSDARRRKLLAERAQAITSQESSKWVSAQENASQPSGGGQ